MRIDSASDSFLRGIDGFIGADDHRPNFVGAIL